MSKTSVDSTWRRPRARIYGAYLGKRRSVSGAIMIQAKGAVSWLSRMQAVTISGTSEAGSIALSEAVEEV